ncbi:MAG: exodeoxyribonuclease V subunit gamma [Deltaproteobacteria bacterium]|nr:exodeoxyribonuclease V subunit gamma [Deltaproteobacteria bacterium]
MAIPNEVTSFRLVTSNKLELLFQELTKILPTPLPSPFVPEVILVQSKGMERWLSMQLASHLGVCANYHFPFPNAFLNKIFEDIVPDFPDPTAFDPKFCAWRIMKILPEYLDRPGFESLRAYLGDSGQSLKRLQLATSIAQTFEQYIIYRPDMISDWESGRETHWQAGLWRGLISGHEREHRAALGLELFQKITEASPGDFHLPQRVSLFGISYLPPAHMRLLVGLSHLIEVNMFLLRPCVEYRRKSAADQKKPANESDSDLRLLSGHDIRSGRGDSLLASMGTMGQEFFELISAQNIETINLFDHPGEMSLLACIQSDILTAGHNAAPFSDRTILSATDKSVQIHSCHSPMREIEVLYDQLLEMFEHDPGLQPMDILVMAPDIESYAPFIQAVFESPGDEQKRIPYTVADRSMNRESQIIDKFLAILDLPGERLTAPQIMEILEVPSIRDKFGFTDSELELLVQWVRDVRIKWGLDEDFKVQWGLESFPENTLRAGLDRLLLGYALPGRNRTLFEGILPYGEIAGSDAAILGGFTRFLDELFKLITSLGVGRTLQDWSQTLAGILSDFFVLNEDAKWEVHALTQAIAELGRIQEVSGFNQPVDLGLIKWSLSRYLRNKGFGFGFITGGATFCSMLPMRSIPFKVICLIGMNGDAFPGQSSPLEFDLIAQHPKPGDRSKRTGDRYLFLETIISARTKLYISYTGQSCQDNSVIPPSIVVSELIDYINHGFRASTTDNDDWFITRHRLQAFNPDYFRGDTGLFSYSRQHLTEAQHMMLPKQQPSVFMAGHLSQPEESFKTISISNLCSFFTNPTRFFLNHRLGLYLEDNALGLEDEESFDLGGLEKYSLGQELVALTLADGKPDDFFPVKKASGVLPHGTPGDCLFKELSQGVATFVGQTRPQLQGRPLEPLDVTLPLAGFNLNGRIQPIYQDKFVQYRYAILKGKDYVRAWIHHLVLNLSQAPGYPKKSMVIGLKDNSWCGLEYQPVPNAHDILEQLLWLYWTGLSQPLHFFPETSWEYAKWRLQKNSPAEYAGTKAETVWLGHERKQGERSLDPHLELCFRYLNPLDEEFYRISQQIFQPLLAHLKEV